MQTLILLAVHEAHAGLDHLTLRPVRQFPDSYITGPAGWDGAMQLQIIRFTS